MTTITKSPKSNQKVAPSPKKRNCSTRQNHFKKRRVFQRSALCLSFLFLSFTTTSVALAFVELDSTRRAVDIYGRVTGDKDAFSINQSLNTVEDYLRQSQEFYRNITRKNLPGILNQLESILGQLGIANPRKYPQTIEDILNGSAIPDGTPTTPGEIYVKQQTITDTANSGSFWIYMDSILGNGTQEGQEQLEAMNQTSVASTQASIQGQQKSLSQSEQAIKSAEIARSASASVERLSLKAQQRKVTQGIMQDIAAQQAWLGLGNSALASSLATLSQQSALAAAQTAALATQSQIGNKHLTQLQVGQSIGNVQLHDIFNAQRHANQMSVMESQKNAQLSVGSTDAIYIPGLFSGQAQALRN